MKVLFFTRYTRQGASSRVRTYQFIPVFEAQGILCDVSPLFDDKYLKILYNNKKISVVHVLWRYLLRLFTLPRCLRYDLIVIEKELFPHMPATFELFLSWLGVNYIVDYDDAIFHNYDLHPNRFVKWLLSNKIARVMKHAAAVVAGNEYLQDYAVKSEAKRTLIIPTVIDTSAYKVKDYSQSSPEVIIGWIGSPSTLQYVALLKPLLEEMQMEHKFELHIIGGKGGVGLGDMERVLEWSEDTEVDMIRQLDIGIMPLKDELWEYGKCGYKLIQYMGCGVAVIGSPVGVNDKIIREGVNGFKPANEAAWKEAFHRLIVDEGLRRSMGKAGRKIVEEGYSLEIAAKSWSMLFEDLVAQGKWKPVSL